MAGLSFNPFELLGSVISSAVGSQSAKEQRAFEVREAEKQRDFSANQTLLQRQWNEQMMNQQNAWNEEMWNKQNLYNTPSEQVRRLRDAGLNPLYYGLDGSSASGVQSAQALGSDTASYSRASASAFDNPVTAGLDSAARLAQIFNIQADTAKKTEEGISEVFSREKTIQEIENLKQDLNNKLASEKLTDVQREQIQKSIDWLDRLNEATIAEKESSTSLNHAQQKRIEELLEGEKLLQSKSIADFEHRWKKISAEISKMADEESLLELDIENYALNHAQSGILGSGASIPNLTRLFERFMDPDNKFTRFLSQFGRDNKR